MQVNFHPDLIVLSYDVNLRNFFVLHKAPNTISSTTHKV